VQDRRHDKHIKTALALSYGREEEEEEADKAGWKDNSSRLYASATLLYMQTEFRKRGPIWKQGERERGGEREREIEREREREREGKRERERERRKEREREREREREGALLMTSVLCRSPSTADQLVYFVNST
jgi:hypothetical protein